MSHFPGATWPGGHCWSLRSRPISPGRGQRGRLWPPWGGESSWGPLPAFLPGGCVSQPFCPLQQARGAGSGGGDGPAGSGLSASKGLWRGAGQAAEELLPPAQRIFQVFSPEPTSSPQMSQLHEKTFPRARTRPPLPSSDPRPPAAATDLSQWLLGLQVPPPPQGLVGMGWTPRSITAFPCKVKRPCDPAAVGCVLPTWGGREGWVGQVCAVVDSPNTGSRGIRTSTARWGGHGRSQRQALCCLGSWNAGH